MKITTVFAYIPPIGGVESVYLAGDFNNWQPFAYEMKEEGGVYSLALELKKGRYAYKFVVDGKWLTDERATHFLGDGLGGLNSVIEVGKVSDLYQLYSVPFKFIPQKQVKDVRLVGSFNHWDVAATKMREENGCFKCTALLKPGTYQYKFLVDEALWLPDPQNPLHESDGYGSYQSIIEVDEDSGFKKYEPQRGNGQISTFLISSLQNSEQISPLSSTTLEIKAKAYKNDVERIFLVIDGKRLLMEVFAENKIFEFFRAECPLSEKTLAYYFIYEDGRKLMYLGKNGFCHKEDDLQPFVFNPQEVKLFYTPDWLKDGVIYQIFTDRFYNGNAGLNPAFEEWYYRDDKEIPQLSEMVRKGQYHFNPDWYDVKKLGDTNNPDNGVFYGGDLAGVLEKLPYLLDLGINIIYFNPLNVAESVHKYDALDYLTIDPHFGGNEAFLALVEKCHANGIRIIVDFAFNHTGNTHFAFQDALRKGKGSKYFEWYEWRKFPIPKPLPDNFVASDYYQCWWGFSHLPDLDYDKARPHPSENNIKKCEDADVNWSVVNYILTVAEHWLTFFKIDGFRLDVPNEVPWWFWELFRKKVKELNPQAYLVGEIWHDAALWVNEKYFDGVMNYSYFRDPVTQFFGSRTINAVTFISILEQGLIQYPLQALTAMMNLVSSHDTYRYFEITGGDYRRLELSYLFMMCYLGIPHIYYGDEIGMGGRKDPDNRRPFDWKYEENPQKIRLRACLKSLIALRRDYPALRLGSVEFVDCGLWQTAFFRKHKDSELLIVINNSETEQKINIANVVCTSEPVYGDAELSLQNSVLQVKLQPFTGVVLNITCHRKKG